MVGCTTSERALRAGLFGLISMSTFGVASANATFFNAPRVYQTGSDPLYIASGDLNNDGRLDVIVSNQAPDTTLSVFLGNGDGSLAAKTDLGAGEFPDQVVIGDLNADGRADLVMANGYHDLISIFIGNGQGGFAPHTDIAMGSDFGDIALAQLDSDGHLDLLVGGATLWLLRGNGNGT